MHLGLLTQERLSFDPIKPLILRGPPTEDSTTVFTGNVVLSLSKSTKINSITVTFKSTATTYWPEGIGARGTRLTHEKVLNDESVVILEAKKNEHIKLSAGIHRFSFVFIVPNSIVETIEDVYGRVKHTIDARVTGPGIQLLNNWHISKPVLVLRSYMSDSFLTNNSVQDLSRTYEKHLPTVDIQLVVERAAFSSGDLFYLKLIMQPQRKKVRLDHMELTVTENRRYHVSEVHANRTDAEQFQLSYLASVKLIDNEEVEESNDALRSVFDKHGRGVDLVDTIAYRITFATPTCMRNIHHTTYYKDILFKHHLSISMAISYVDEEVSADAWLHRPGLNSHQSSSSSLAEDGFPTFPASASYPSSAFASASSTPQSSPSSSTTTSMTKPSPSMDTMPIIAPPPAAFALSSYNTNTHIRQPVTHTANPAMFFSPPPSQLPHQPPLSQPTWLSKLRKPINAKEGGKHVIRKRETIRLETPIGVFDCRLKEDYGRLPSYSELNVTARPTVTKDDKHKKQDMLEQDLLHYNHSKSPESYQASSSVKEPQPQLCPCYFKFRRQMEMASQAQLLAANDRNNNATLERIPSIPPPDYVETA